MKSTKTDKPSDVEYPCLMMGNNGRVVLFTDRKIGTSIAIDDYGDLGEYSTNWDMQYFAPYTGKVTLENGD